MFGVFWKSSAIFTTQLGYLLLTSYNLMQKARKMHQSKHTFSTVFLVLPVPIFYSLRLHAGCMQYLLQHACMCFYWIFHVCISRVVRRDASTATFAWLALLFFFLPSISSFCLLRLAHSSLARAKFGKCSLCQCVPALSFYCITVTAASPVLRVAAYRLGNFFFFLF